MDRDFHYYATYLAAVAAKFTNEQARVIATSAQFIDDCTESVTYDARFRGWYPHVYDVKTGDDISQFYPLVTSVYGMTSWTPSSNYDETRQIWMPFHFLPGNYKGQKSKHVTLRASNTPLDKNSDPTESIDLLCRPRSDTSQHMINFVVKEYNRIAQTDEMVALMLVGCCMHVFADTYAHQDFAGTASYRLNSTKNAVGDNPGKFTNYGSWKDLKWEPDRGTLADIVWPTVGIATGDPLTTYPPNTGRVGRNMVSLGHGQVGHMPDVSTIFFKYSPQWSDNDLERNNPTEYMNAFCDMVKAMECIRGNNVFEWFENDKAQQDFAGSISEAIDEVKQLLCPDDKSEIDQKIYDLGLCIEGREWFLFSEERWSRALRKICRQEGFNPTPGYNEAKHGWPLEAIQMKKDGAIDRDKFIALNFIKWNVAAKMLFSNTYLKLRTLENGLMRIVREWYFSKTMDIRNHLINEFDIYWVDKPDSKVTEANLAIAGATTTDEMDNALLLPKLEVIKPSVQMLKGWITLKNQGKYLSYIEESSLPDFVKRKIELIPSVSAEKKSARPMFLVDADSEDGTVYIRTLENKGGSTIYIDYPTSVVAKVLYYNTLKSSENQQWKINTSIEEESNKYTMSFQSVKYPGWYLGNDGKTILAVNSEIFWELEPYVPNVDSVPGIQGVNEQKGQVKLG